MGSRCRVSRSSFHWLSWKKGKAQVTKAGPAVRYWCTERQVRDVGPKTEIGLIFKLSWIKDIAYGSNARAKQILPHQVWHFLFSQTPTMTTFYGSYTISSQQIYPFNSIATTSKCEQSELPGWRWLGEITMTLWALSSSSLPSINFIEYSLGICSSLQLQKVRNETNSPACYTGQQSCILIRESEQLNNIQSSTNYSTQNRFAFKMLKTTALKKIQKPLLPCGTRCANKRKLSLHS